ncbi:MAG TPA: NAD-dependent DNA ligase LigA [Bacteroidales bacterium]|nr:NAD-dependent DNA ligase LigA [Bacteroidales bacterium]
MDISAAADRIRELKQAINNHNNAYYVLNAPRISDFEYDLLVQELLGLERKYPELATDDSPTQHVGSDLSASVTSFQKVRHKVPMLSLSNTYDRQELQDFHNRVLKATEGSTAALEYVCELKLDGTAICLSYKDGRLVRALTRGDGTYGDDVTANILRIASVPALLKPAETLSVPYPREFEIRGEILMSFNRFRELNESREETGEPLFANPRNAAAGTLKLLSSDEVARRGLDCFVYHLVTETEGISTQWQALEAAHAWGFPVSNQRKLCKSPEEITEFLDFWDTERTNLPIATDGVVIKVNDFKLHKVLGMTAKSPRWATAYKFRAEQAATRLLSVDFQVGRTGAITPVANLEPVFLSGTTVKRASLHNADQIALHDIRLGDTVFIEKGGEIIPKVVGVDLGLRPEGTHPFLYIHTCPECGTPLKRDPGEAKHFCPNKWACPPQIKGRIEHFMNRKAMNILGGEALVEQLFTKQLVTTPADLYDLTPEKLETLTNWGPKSTENLLESIATSRSTPFPRVLYALGIPFVGETTAKYLADHFGSLRALQQAPFEELTEAPEIGEKIAQSIRDFFQEEQHTHMLEKLKSAGLAFEQQQDATQVLSDTLQGKRFVISGTFTQSREDIKNLIAANGGKVLASITGQTDYFLTGAKTGPSKMKKAAELGIPTINENEFMALIEKPQTLF